MVRELADLILFIIIIAVIGYFACWRLFRPIGKVAENEINKVKAEIKKDEAEETK